MALIKLFANLRKVAGMKETSITGASVGAVVSELVKRYPALAESLLVRSPGGLPGNGQIRPHVIITINGNPITDVNVAVTEQDQIAIFPPMAGG